MITKKFDWSDAVQVHPWVGERYEQPLHLPKKTLLLGESNYTKPELFNSGLVHACVLDDMDLGGKERDTGGFCRFSTKTRRIIFGHLANVGPRVFWPDVAFYNFVQQRVGENARQRPTPEMWAASVPAFIEVVRMLQPERVLVLGKANWNNLRDHMPTETIDDWSSGMTVAGKTLKAGYVNHPSSSIRYSTWDPIVQKFLFA